MHNIEQLLVKIYSFLESQTYIHFSFSQILSSKNHRNPHSKMSTDYTFKGWMGLSADAAKGNMVWKEYVPKSWEETDIDVQVTHCGICGSDIHVLREGWGKNSTDYPCVVGHEVVGKTVRVGSQVVNFKVGDRVGVGSYIDSCNSCPDCVKGQPQFCTKVVGTYNDQHKNRMGKTYGGYADYIRVPAKFVFKIPDGVSSEIAAPILCAGITVYAPLQEHGCAGKTVGVIGIGGIGHLGLIFAKALGAAKVVAISRSSSKKFDALKLGADDMIATGEDTEWATNAKNARSLDLILSTVSNADMPLSGYLNLLRPRGRFIQLGAPDDMLPNLHAFSLIQKNILIGGSCVGTPMQIEEMLQLVVDKQLQPRVETRPIEDANQAVLDMEDGKSRFRYVLVNKKHLDI
jgi:D-arabinose 1-dehydrogenase-like Zn-dependent alcohol dehydrogenase